MATRNVKPKTILEVGLHECRWPVKFDKREVATHFCARPTITDTSRWCEVHQPMSGQKPKKPVTVPRGA